MIQIIHGRRDQGAGTQTPMHRLGYGLFQYVAQDRGQGIDRSTDHAIGQIRAAPNQGFLIGPPAGLGLGLVNKGLDLFGRRHVIARLDRHV